MNQISKPEFITRRKGIFRQVIPLKEYFGEESTNNSEDLSPKRNSSNSRSSRNDEEDVLELVELTGDDDDKNTPTDEGNKEDRKEKSENGNRSFKGRHLTKSRFMAAIKNAPNGGCLTRLYFENSTSLPATSDDYAEILQLEGVMVGELAKLYYPGGFDLSGLSTSDAVTRTKELLQNEDVVIFEAAISTGDRLVRVDVLDKRGSEIELIEVKSDSIDPASYTFETKSGSLRSAFKPLLYDVAFQTMLFREAFPEYRVSPFLTLVNSSQIATVDGLNRLFKTISDGSGNNRVVCAVPTVSLDDLGEELLVKVPVNRQVGKIINGVEYDANGHEQPFVDFVAHCSSVCNGGQVVTPKKISRNCKHCPHRDSCFKEFFGWTDDDFNDLSIFDIRGLHFATTDKLLDRGITFAKDVDLKSTFMKKTKDGQEVYKSTSAKMQAIQIAKTLSRDDEPFVDPQLFDELQKLRWPIHCIDFETATPFLPFKGDKPRTMAAFQWSDHIIHEDGRIEHAEHLFTDASVSPNVDFVRSLRKQLLNDDGSFVHYAPHEKTVLSNLLKYIQGRRGEIPDAPELEKWLQEVTADDNNKMVDLHKWTRNYFYQRKMGKSSGLKAIVPAVTSISPTLQAKYSQPYMSSNFPKGITWFHKNDQGEIKDCYETLGNTMKEKPITNGISAAASYARMRTGNATYEETKSISANLLKYCELDTLGLVWLLEYYRELAKGKGISF